MTAPDLPDNAALLLDLDGTVLDFAPTPDSVIVPPGLIAALLGLRARLGDAVAVVSGRPVAQVDALLCDAAYAVAGEHGAALRPSPGAAVLRPALPAVPADWRTEVHYEFDFRDLHYTKPESALGVPMDKCSLAVVQDEKFKFVHFAALPPLLFDLAKDPGQFVNCATDPAYAATVADYARKMLDWRLGYAERTLTGYRATPQGLEVRAA